jgi:hypothetical protein
LSWVFKWAGKNPEARKLSILADQGIEAIESDDWPGKYSLIGAMSDVESIINFDKWSATTFSVPFSSSIPSCLKVSKISESWLTSLCLVIAWGNGSAGGESVSSLQCSGSTLSLPSETNSSSFSQGLRIGFSITLPL